MLQSRHLPLKRRTSCDSLQVSGTNIQYGLQQGCTGGRCAHLLLSIVFFFRHFRCSCPALAAYVDSPVWQLLRLPESVDQVWTSVMPRHLLQCSFECFRTHVAQVGSSNFQYSLQQLPDLVYLWSTSTNLNITNTTIPGFTAGVPTMLLYDVATVVRLDSKPCQPTGNC